MNQPGGLHLLAVTAEDSPSGVMIELYRRLGSANDMEEPRIGERYVVFDDDGWLGIGEVTSSCGCRIQRPARACPDAGIGANASPNEIARAWSNARAPLTWSDMAMQEALNYAVPGCSLRWVARAPRLAAAMIRDPSFWALGPTRERWEKLRVMSFTRRFTPCPKGQEGVICVLPTEPHPVAWKTLFAIDLDLDGSADVELREWTCAAVENGLLMYEVRVRQDQQDPLWIPVQRWAMPTTLPGG